MFVENQALMGHDAVRHTISDDMEVLDMDTPEDAMIIPMKYLKYLSCDATVCAKKSSSTQSCSLESQPRDSPGGLSGWNAPVFSDS